MPSGHIGHGGAGVEQFSDDQIALLKHRKLRQAMTAYLAQTEPSQGHNAALGNGRVPGPDGLGFAGLSRNDGSVSIESPSRRYRSVGLTLEFEQSGITRARLDEDHGRSEGLTKRISDEREPAWKSFDGAVTAKDRDTG
jgi:hypothetical protein